MPIRMAHRDQGRRDGACAPVRLCACVTRTGACACSAIKMCTLQRCTSTVEFLRAVTASSLRYYLLTSRPKCKQGEGVHTIRVLVCAADDFVVRACPAEGLCDATRRWMWWYECEPRGEGGSNLGPAAHRHISAPHTSWA